ncbi:hypothetical protein XELAEV_18029181mg [Xenopus laevis]|uniref:Uncharacterized protein n=1 Tax=Xenopus laevis TaxID=8355 RepID=A0A974CSY8_XENLA|nr:hypothetical protein XELAEV_18029181mg [Xenopus laevis]
MYAFREIKTHNLDAIFKGESTPSLNKSNFLDIEMFDCFDELELSMSKEVKAWWEKVTLSKYIENKITPRGLRIKKEPTFGKGDKEFITEWDEILDTCTIKLMQLIIKQRNKELEVYNKEIKNIHTKLEPFKEIDEFANCEKLMVERLNRLEDSIIDTKQRKFKRDLDYRL